MSDELIIRPMTRNELDTLVEWAADEGWNPGLHDAEIFWQTDPQGFITAELKGEMIGGGTIVSYDGQFGFMGFFIIKPEYRGHGLGAKLWNFRKEKLVSRLRQPALIGLDGVFTMQEFYARGGFKFFNRSLRYAGLGEPGPLAETLVDLADVPFDELLSYDSTHFPVSRPQFLKPWITQPDSRALGAVKENGLCGYGVVRACRRGFKIGPLFAKDAETAEDLFCGLSDHAQGQPLFLDAPEINPAAVSLAKHHAMKEVFGCARMYIGAPPDLPHDEIFGVTTFELG